LSTTAIAAGQDWVSAVKVGKTNGNVEAFEPGGLCDDSYIYCTELSSTRRNAPQKPVNCSPFSD